MLSPSTRAIIDTSHGEVWAVSQFAAVNVNAEGDAVASPVSAGTLRTIARLRLAERPKPPLSGP